MDKIKNSDSDKTKYSFIVDDLTAKIRSGKLAPGARLPGNYALAKEYGVSAITSKRALNELRLAELVERRERSGSYVRKNPRLLREVIVVSPKDDFSEDQQMIDYWRGIASVASDLGILNCALRSVGSELMLRIKESKGELGLAFLSEPEAELLAAARDSQAPSVVVGLDSVAIQHQVLEDRRGAARELTLALAKSGCESLLYAGKGDARSHRLARDGFFDAIEILPGVRHEALVVDDDSVRSVLEKAFRKNPPDGVLLMGAGIPLAALPFLLGLKKRPKMGFFTENSLIAQLKEQAFLAIYSQFETGKLAMEMLYSLAAGEIRAATVNYSPYHISSPSLPE